MNRGSERQLDHRLREDAAIFDGGSPAVEGDVAAEVGGVRVEIDVIEAELPERGLGALIEVHAPRWRRGAESVPLFAVLGVVG